jgi:hypothetical protein
MEVRYHGKIRELEEELQETVSQERSGILLP